tara:strand:+ start:4613 stop:4927 length:315 start_codon:yes stop_codon:yes gene_type:complete
MKLMTKEILEKIPALYTNEEKNEGEIRIFAKFFHPFSSWTWYATEYDPEQELCFGLVDGHDVELGYFSLAEMKEVKIMGCGIERDLHWDDTKTLADVQSVIRLR